MTGTARPGDLTLPTPTIRRSHTPVTGLWREVGFGKNKEISKQKINLT
jgi:hypothetical protein